MIVEALVIVEIWLIRFIQWFTVCTSPVPFALKPAWHVSWLGGSWGVSTTNKKVGQNSLIIEKPFSSSQYCSRAQDWFDLETICIHRKKGKEFLWYSELSFSPHLPQFSSAARCFTKNFFANFLGSINSTFERGKTRGSGKQKRGFGNICLVVLECLSANGIGIFSYLETSCLVPFHISF